MNAFSETDDNSSDTENVILRRAIRQFARVAYAALARKVVFALQRIKASGIFGDDWNLKTLWDEYCYEKQNGPHEQLDYAWESVMTSILDEVLKAVAHEEAALLTIRAAWDLDEDDDLTENIVPNSDQMRRNLKQFVDEIAAKRDISRLDPTMCK